MPKKKVKHKVRDGKPFYKICVSGSAVDICGIHNFERAYDVGKEIAKAGAILVNGATTGTPYEAARGAKEAGGMVIGLSPAASKSEHVNKYHLPLDFLDMVVYTGFNYSGRNLLLTRSSDAVVFVCGRIGTLNEFTIAFEDKKPIGILEDSGGIISEIDDILRIARRGHKNIVFDKDPKKLIAKVVKMIEERDKKIEKVRKKHDHGRKHGDAPAPQAAIPE